MDADILPAAMVTKLEPLFTPPTGSVAVTRSDHDGQGGYTWSVTFLTQAGDLEVMTPVPSALHATGVKLETAQVTAGNQLDGTFTLTYNGRTTLPIAYNADATGTATSVKQRLTDLSSVGVIDVTRSGPDTERGYVWTVVFGGDGMQGDLPAMTADWTHMTGIGAVVDVAEAVKGQRSRGSELSLAFEPPTDNDSFAITSYVVEWDASSSFASTTEELLHRHQVISTSHATIALSAGSTAATTRALWTGTRPLWKCALRWSRCLA